jgi:hypothetical protein
VTLLEYALDALGRGLRVFPLHPQSKEPNGGLVPHGSKDSSTDAETVRRWWTVAPRSNIGVHGGTIVDCDSGIASFEEAECWRTLCGLPATLAVRTGRRSSFGVQYHYSGQTKTGPYEFGGVTGEIRSGNVYGLWQGSIHPETRQTYELVADLPFAPWPTGSALEESKNRTEVALALDPATLNGNKIARSMRQYWLVKQCARLRRMGVNGAALFTALCALRDSYCEAPTEKTDAMLRQICESGERLYGVHGPELDSRPEVAALLAEFNQKYFMVSNVGGRPRVCWEEENPLFPGHFTLELQSQKEFCAAHRKRRVKVAADKDGEPVYKPAATVWLDHEYGNIFERVIYAPPGIELPDNARNLWRGFSYQPLPGNCQLYLNHLKRNICLNKKERFDWLTKWMAYGVRNPGEPGHTCVVLKGSEGCGKNSAADPYAMLWGSHHLIVTHSRHFTGNFNSHLRALSVVVANESFFAGDPSQVAALKGLITDAMLPIESKGVDLVMTKNLLHVFIIGNSDWLVPASIDARRFTVFECGDKHRNDAEYFSAMWKQLNDGGFSALLYYLLNDVNLTGFNPRQHLPTGELDEQKARTLHGADSLWYECLQTGEIPLQKIFADNSVTLRATELAEWAAKKNLGERWRMRVEHFGFLFKKLGFEKTRDGQQRVFIIPPLAVARKIWDEKRFTGEWDEGGAWKLP